MTALTYAKQANGFGPLSTGFLPFWLTDLRSLDELSVAVSIEGPSLDVTWLISNQIPDRVLY